MRLLSIFFTWFKRIRFYFIDVLSMMWFNDQSADNCYYYFRQLFFTTDAREERLSTRPERGASNIVSSAYNVFSKIFL